MDDRSLRALERATLESPDDGAAGLAYASALGRAGARRRQFRELARLGQLGVRAATRELSEWRLTGRELAECVARPLDRWCPVDELLTCWHRGLSASDGYAPRTVVAAERRLGIQLPQALREWLLRGGRCRAARLQGVPLSPASLYIQDGALVFWQENQCVGVWGVRLEDLHLADPPVYLFGRDDDDQRERENERLSQFVLQMLVVELLAVANVVGLGFSREEASRLARGFVSLRLPPWHYPAFPTLLYGSDELLLGTSGDGEIEVRIAARERGALAELLASLPPALRARLECFQ